MKTVSQYVQTYKIISLNENRRIDLEFLHHQNKMELNHENIASRITMALTNVKIELKFKFENEINYHWQLLKLSFASSWPRVFFFRLEIG